MTPNDSGARAPKTPSAALEADMFALYSECAANVMYTTEAGERRKYRPNRYLQALRRAADAGGAEVVALAKRMVTGEPTRGFGYLVDAGRLDLTVEALVADAGKPYHHLFDSETVEAARQRLADAGYVVGEEPSAPGGLSGAIVRTEDGVAVELVTEITAEGTVRLHAGDRTETATGTLAAVRAYADLLAEAEAAARG